MYVVYLVRLRSKSVIINNKLIKFKYCVILVKDTLKLHKQVYIYFM